MRDRKLIVLIVLAAFFSLDHALDHILRGDLPWAFTSASIPFIQVSLAIYGPALIAVGLYLYWNNRVGPGFWSLVAAAGAALGWLAHFSPFTDQTPRYILDAYPSRIIGWLALSSLIGLMLTLIVTAVYAGYLWKQNRSAR